MANPVANATISNFYSCVVHVHAEKKAWSAGKTEFKSYARTEEPEKLRRAKTLSLIAPTRNTHKHTLRYSGPGLAVNKIVEATK